MNSHHRRWTLLFTFLALALAFVVGAILLELTRFYSLDQIRDNWSRVTPYAALVRLTLIGLTAAFWGPITRFIAARYRMDAPGQERMYAARWRIVGWMMVIELVVGQDIINRFIVAMG
jgi:hypothetical protein